MPDRDSKLNEALDDVVARLVAIAGLGGIALIHVLQLPDAFAAIDYLGVLFIIAIVAALGLAALMTRMSDEVIWAATGLLPALLLIGFVLSRTSGLPGFTDDVGDWSERLGLLSLVVEGLLVCLSATVLMSHETRLAPERRARREAGPGRAFPQGG
jgi:hypothetical protein